MRPVSKIKDKELGVVVHACKPSTLGGGDRRIWVPGQPQLLSEALRNLVRPGFKIKYKKNRAGGGAQR